MESRKTLKLSKVLSPKTLSKIKVKRTPGETKRIIAQDKQRKKQRIQNAVQWLCVHYPKCFDLLNLRPLKLKIEEDVFRACELISDNQGIPSKKSLRDAISCYTRNIKYIKSHLKYTHRINLEGEELSNYPITTEHITYARKMIEQVKSKGFKPKNKKAKK